MIPRAAAVEAAKRPDRMTSKNAEPTVATGGFFSIRRPAVSPPDGAETRHYAAPRMEDSCTIGYRLRIVRGETRDIVMSRGHGLGHNGGSRAVRKAGREFFRSDRGTSLSPVNSDAQNTPTCRDRGGTNR